MAVGTWPAVPISHFTHQLERRLTLMEAEHQKHSVYLSNVVRDWQVEQAS